MANKRKRKQLLEAQAHQTSTSVLPVELTLPFEFIVDGAPATLQSSSERKKTWKAGVASAAKSARGGGVSQIKWGSEVKARIWYYFVEKPADGDIDNIIKPILDACNKIVYQDDKFVKDVCSRRINIDQVPAELLNPLTISAIDLKYDFVHIKFEPV